MMVSGMFVIDRRKAGLLYIDICQLALVFIAFLYSEKLTYSAMSIMAIAQWLINIILLKVFCFLPLISIPNIFSFFSLIFHCGQVIKEGFDIEGTVPLPFQNYADFIVTGQSFIYYILSQAIFFLVLGLTTDIGIDYHMSNKWIAKENVDAIQYGKILFIIGIIPRLYIDIIRLVGAMQSGYRGVYSIYIPQALDSIVFFADAGLILLLFSLQKRGQRRTLFIIVTIYKIVVMSSGSRQYSVAFLLIWIYIYFFVIYSISFHNTIFLIVVTILGFYFISAIGEVRSDSSYGLSQILNVFQSGGMSNTIGNSLGEFGSALVTLEIAIRYTPQTIAYGFGRTYIAGLISIIPLLVNQIPFLRETVIFVHQLPGSVYFALGGSYLGELYYNFGWFGVIGSGFIAHYLAKLHDGITKTSEDHNLYRAWCAIVSTAMILFVRGYFTDMIQRLVWTYFVIYLISLYVKKRTPMG